MAVEECVEGGEDAVGGAKGRAGENDVGGGGGGGGREEVKEGGEGLVMIGGEGGLEDVSLVASQAMAEVLEKEVGEEGDGEGEGSEGGCEFGWRRGGGAG